MPKVVLSMAFLLLRNKDLGSLFSYCVSKKNCLLFNNNFPAEKVYRLLDSIVVNYLLKEPKSHFLFRTRSLLFCHAILTIDQSDQ